MENLKFEQYVDMKNINDSLELDSGIEVARLTCKTPKGTIVATLEIRGDVRVHYRDTTYRCASQMPKELLGMLHDWKDEYSDIVKIDNNNWPEVFLWIKEIDKLVWTGDSEVAEVEGMSSEEIETMLREYIEECLS